MREDQLCDIITEIYDTALDSALSSGVLARIRDFVGGRTCALVSKDPASGLGNIPHQVGLDPHFVRTYSDIYAPEDPMALFMASNRSLPPIGQVMSMWELVREDDYRQQRCYQEWFKPQERADTAVVVLEKAATEASYLAMVPSKASAMVCDVMRRRIALIAPHARRAVLIGKAMELQQTETATFADALNSFSAGVFLVDASGQIVHANEAGHDMLYANDFLRAADGRLITCDPQVNEIFREVFAAAAKGDTGIGAKAIALALRAHDGDRYVAHVLPLTSGERRATGIAYTAVAAVFVRKPTLGSPAEVIAQSYKLTPTELRVLLAIVEVGGVPETAAALGVAETTIRTHLYRLFDKTDASRQADLVKLVAGFSNPFVG